MTPLSGFTFSLSLLLEGVMPFFLLNYGNKLRIGMSLMPSTQIIIGQVLRVK